MTAQPNPLLADYLAGLSVPYRHELSTILRKWCGFLEVLGIQRTPELLCADPAAWDFVTGDLLSRYRQRLLDEGYIHTTANRHLAMLRPFIRIVHRAGGITDKDEVDHILRTRRYPLRSGIPASYPPHPVFPDTAPQDRTLLTPAKADWLKHKHPDTLQGWRDALLMCLLLNHGLLVTALATLKGEDFNLPQGLLRYHDPREDEEQVYRLSADTLHAVSTYLATDASLTSDVLFRAIKKNGQVGKISMEPNHIVARVHIIGKQILGISTLRPQDCRQYWTTTANRFATDI